MNKVLDEALRGKALKRRNILLVRPRDAIELVHLARELHVPVLGIDGFHLLTEGIQPDLEHSIDLSLRPPPGSNTWSRAEEFLRARVDLDMYFEFVFGEGATN